MRSCDEDTPERMKSLGLTRPEPVHPQRRLERDDGEVDRVRIEIRQAPIRPIGRPARSERHLPLSRVCRRRGEAAFDVPESAATNSVGQMCRCRSILGGSASVMRRAASALRRGREGRRRTRTDPQATPAAPRGARPARRGRQREATPPRRRECHVLSEEAPAVPIATTSSSYARTCAALVSRT